MTINFYLHTQKSRDVKKAIYLDLNFTPIKDYHIRWRITTGLFVNEKFWNNKKKKVNASAPNAELINNILNSLQNSLLSFYLNKINLGESFDKNEVKDIINSIVKPKTIQSIPDRSISNLLNSFIQNRRDEIKKSTLQKYTTLRNHLLAFNKNLIIDKLNDQSLINFQKYLLQKKLTNHSIDGLFVKLKTFLKWCLTNGIVNDHKIIELVPTRKEIGAISSNQIALTSEELDLVWSVAVDERLDRIRDLFLIQCYTGVRYSDLRQMKNVNIDLQHDVITLYIIKTNSKHEIPIHPKIKPIFLKYPVHLPIISNQKYNQYLKELCKTAKIDEKVQVVKYYGKERKESVLPKYELVSSHTGRRTMITLSLKAGLIPEIVMQISGHSDRRSFEKYVRVSKDEAHKMFISKFEDK